MDWQQKFSSLAKETECNLTRVKNQLYRAAPKLINNQAPIDPDTPLHYVPLDQSPGIITILQERLDDQAKAIQNLTRAVRGLQDEREVNLKSISQLRGELCDLKDSMMPKMQNTELVQWQHTVTGDVQSLHNQVQLHCAHNSSHSALNNEMYENHMFHDIFKEFRLEMDSLRSHLMRLELMFTSCGNESAELHQRQEHLNRTLKNIVEIQNRQLHELAVTKNNICEHRAQLEQLKLSYCDLAKQLTNLSLSPLATDSQKCQNVVQLKSPSLNDFMLPHCSKSTIKTTSWSHPSYLEELTAPASIGHALSDLDQPPAMKHSEILPLPKENPEKTDLSSEEDDDYLLSDLNLSLEDFSSDGESLYDDNLV